MTRVKRYALTAAVLVGLAGAAGVVVLLSGFVPIKASSGHWAITEWVLQLGKERSLATHTMFMDALDLDAPWLVLKGAGHYESGCRPCHGAPDLPRPPRVARAMLPPPPPLVHTSAKWDDEELFYIVKHGIKFTGMPAWPAVVRDDEVRALVAFLRALPALDGASYRRLVHGETTPEVDAVPLEDLVGAEDPPAAVRTTCARCHGLLGRGRGSAAFPALAGQRYEYLRASLRAYLEGHRPSGIMETATSGLTEADLDAVARYYAGQPPLRLPAGELALPRVVERPTPAERDPAAVLRGQAIATLGIPAQRVPACVACHGPAPHDEAPDAPILAGQYADYLEDQLALFKQRIRGGSPYAHLMHPVVEDLSSQQMRDVALFFSSLGEKARAP